jgi:hypothetical protein
VADLNTLTYMTNLRQCAVGEALKSALREKSASRMEQVGTPAWSDSPLRIGTVPQFPSPLRLADSFWEVSLCFR